MEEDAQVASTVGEHWQNLASRHWLGGSDSRRKKVIVDVVKKDIWDKLEQENFEYSSLQALEGLQLLEKLVSSSSLLPCHADRLQIPLAGLR